MLTAGACKPGKSYIYWADRVPASKMYAFDVGQGNGQMVVENYIVRIYKTADALCTIRQLNIIGPKGKKKESIFKI